MAKNLPDLPMQDAAREWRRRRFTIGGRMQSSRRAILKTIGVLGASVVAGCGLLSEQDTEDSQDAAALDVSPSEEAPDVAASVVPEPAADAGTPFDEPVCVLTPQATAGPFYFDPDQVRRNIVEDRVGVPFQVSVRVMRVGESCVPLGGAMVDLWHADAGGVYSGFPDQLGGLDTSARAFLRGLQLTDDEGVAQFDTIYPGWYPGRTVHIHFKVHYEGESYLTSQFYFPDEFTDRVFALPPYSERPNRPTRNSNDSVLRTDPAESNLLATVGELGEGYFGNITVGIPQ